MNALLQWSVGETPGGLLIYDVLRQVRYSVLHCPRVIKVSLKLEFRAPVGTTDRHVVRVRSAERSTADGEAQTHVARRGREVRQR